MKVLNLKNISAEKFEEIFDQIIEEKIDQTSIKNFLLDLNKEDLPTNSFIGAVAAFRKRMKKISAPSNAIDVCGTGGDKLGSLNISTAVSFVVAAAQIPVAKHGNKAISSLSGSADIFSELGIKITEEVEKIEKNLREKNLCFLFAPMFHESLKNLSEIRKSLNVATIFNFLGPLLNPANTRLQLIGTSRKNTMLKMAEVVAQNHENKAYIVHGFDGMDEITLTDNSYLVICENGKIFSEQIIDPQKFGLQKVSPEALRGKDAKHNAQKLLALLDGEKSAYRDIVILNCAFAFLLVKKVKKIEDGIDLAKSILDKKIAKKLLEDLQNLNKIT